MKFIVIGLGNFGSSIALTLTRAGHEVIGVDTNEELTNSYKDRLTHCLKLDSTSEFAVKQLPLADTDAVILGIGEDTGSAITTAALFKKYVPQCRIVARYTSQIQKTIYEAMNITELVNPEKEFAENFANKLIVANDINTILLDKEYEIAEMTAPESFVGRTISELGLNVKYGINIITLSRPLRQRNILGKDIVVNQILGIPSEDLTIQKGDVLILFCKIKALELMHSDL